jgi:hypothetical protein
MQQKCQSCHREGDIAPFPLKSYEDVFPRLRAIRLAVESRKMPPWKPVAGHGQFKGSFALSDEERAMLLDWIGNGAPEGDPADMPEPSVSAGEWSLGEPELVLGMAEPFTPQQGADVYRCFVIPTGFDRDRFVSAVDVVPGNRQVVHHVILFLDTSGVSEKLDAAEEGAGYTCFGGPGFTPGIDSALGGWAPGLRARQMPEGVGLNLPAGARVVMQVHYSTAGHGGHDHSEPEAQGSHADQTKFGLYFSKERVQRRLFFIPVFNPLFRIPPGDTRHEVNARFIVPPLLDAKAYFVVPHMHTLGREIQVELERFFAPPQPLIYINDWDFNWQGFYEFVEPVPIPALSSLHVKCTFDNSADNPRNPNNPPKAVTWGEQTSDEMCLAFLGVTLDHEELVLPFLTRRP